MASTELLRNVRTMIGRYKGHLESGDHVLREGSQQQIGHDTVAYFTETDPDTKQRNTNGAFVAPGGLGKTIIGGDIIVGMNTMPNGRFVLGDLDYGKRVLITAPTNMLVDQWAARLLGEMNEETGIRAPSVFGDRFNADSVGVYHATLPDSEKRIALSKPVVIAVHDSARTLYGQINSLDKPFLNPQDFDCVFIDEVDERVRGDVTSKFYKEAFFPHCMIIGATATHLLRNGRTIGDYLFGGKKPICEITHQEAVERREIAPHVNIIVQPEVDPDSIIRPQTPLWYDYTEAEQLRFIEQTGSDNALLEVIAVGSHPVTGQPLKDITKMHQAVNIEHAKHIAEQLNRKFGKGYAEAVWGGADGEMDDELRNLIRWFFTTKQIKAVVQCKLLGRGNDFPELGMTVQHAPSLSAAKIVQFHTRASRLHDGKKTAIFLSPYIEGIDQLVIGEVLGGLYMFPTEYEFPPTQEPNGGSSRKPWPDIQGVKVFHTQRQLEMFASDQRQRRYVNGLPVKPTNMMAVGEMAQVLGINQNILRDRVYDPVQNAYEKVQAREKSIEIEVGKPGEVLHVRGKMFPVARLGLFQHKAQEVFCIEDKLIPLCEHTLYGRLDRAPPEALHRDNVKRLLRCSEQQIEALWQRLQQAFFNRKPYERRVHIGDIEFSHDSFGFYRNREGISRLFLFPDALAPAYQHVYGVRSDEANRWSAEQPAVRQCKTSSWLTESEVMAALDIYPILGGREAAIVQDLFKTIRSQSRDAKPGEEFVVRVGKGANSVVLTASRRWLPLTDTKDQIALCLHKSSLEWIKRELGIESKYSAGNRTNRGNYRSSDQDRPSPP